MKAVSFAGVPVLRRLLAGITLAGVAAVTASAAIPGTVGAGDLVWWDANTNGIQDPGEPGFPFVPVTLYRLGVAVTAMPTDLDGAYFFEDQTAGTYQVGFALPPGFLFSPRDQGGNDAVDSDPNPATGRTDPVALTPNQYTSDWDAGMYGPPVGVGNVVFIDRNGNQRFDEGEGAGGVRVEVYRDLGLAAGTLDGGDEFVGSVTTAPSGVYLFDRLAPAPYLVRIPPGEFIPGRPLYGLRSIPGQGGDSGADDDQDENGSDEAQPATQGCVSVRIMLYPGEEPADATTEAGKDAASDNANDANIDLTVDFGFAAPVCDIVIDTFNDPELTTLLAGPFPLSDPVGLEAARAAALGGFRDMFVDSILAGRTVELSFSDTLAFAEPSSGAGEYYLTYDGSDGDAAPDAVEAATGLGGLDFRGRRFQIEYVRSDVLLGRTITLTLRVYSSPSSYSESVVTVAPGTPFPTVLAFPIPTPVSGGGANLGAVTALRLHFRTTGTAVDGEFDNFVAVCLPSDYGDLPDTLIPGAPDYATRWVDGGPYHVISPGLHLGALSDGESDGLPSALANGDDLDPPGGPDDEEALASLPVFMRGSVATLAVAVSNPSGGSGNATLYAFADLNGDGDFADAGEAQAVPVSDGTVGNVPVAFAVPANAPTGVPVGVRLRLSTAAGLGAGGYAPDGEIEDYLVRIVHPASIGNLVWHDVNYNGVQDGGEPGMAGAVVTLYGAASNAVASVTTGVSGAYAFTNLIPGVYHVGFAPPAGYLLTRRDQGGDDTRDSDADPATGRTPPTTLDSGENDTTWDAGVFALAAVGDFVWEDVNRDGRQDPSEVGMRDSLVTLFTPSSNIVAVTTSDTNGFYLFPGLLPGTYFLRFDVPVGLSVSPKNAGPDDILDNDADVMRGQTDPVTLASRETNRTVDAGLYKLTTHLALSRVALECHEEAIYLVWETAGEWGTALFEVHRRGRDGAWHRLYEDHTLTALGQTARGGLYRLRDHAAEGEPREYLITEIDIRGGRLARGPFVLEVPRMESGPAPVAAYTAEELPVDPRAAARADAATTRPVPPER